MYFVSILINFFLLQMEGLVREMQDPENGVPVRSQKLFLTSIPSAFMGKKKYSPLCLLFFFNIASKIKKQRTLVYKNGAGGWKIFIRKCIEDEIFKKKRQIVK